ncbi:NAD(P)/FAD-dependent oxidoreductase [Nitrincola alkalilacustris]|uniref:flavin-dependent monooxygenase QhpG n=1 Tax=Nitrincola alkalilacustris TaxID=1571224 RepID=UPI00124E1C03|nr:tryptophan 7-halogenase [Nitrincola alkalilacustris]
MSPQILILGGGPAAAATAIGLRRLQYSVTVIAEPRPFTAVEGVSERALQGMNHAGFHHALATVSPPSLRRVTWQGQTSAANTEHLIERQKFDQALVSDMQVAGVDYQIGRVIKLTSDVTGHSVVVRSHDAGEYQLDADFLVEARGRAAPLGELPRLRGPETLSILQYWQGETGQPCSAVENFTDGWAWMARMLDGRRYLQLTLDPAAEKLPPKGELASWCTERLNALTQSTHFMTGATYLDQHARTSTPVLCLQCAGHNWLRIGDAAMAVDPLSGNGIFQAISSALQAPAVINTLLTSPEQQEIAIAFHQERISGLFYRFARVGRDFYAEIDTDSHPFWHARAHWPDQQSLHTTVSPDQVTIGLRSVVDGSLIRERPVVITPDQPMGIWHLQGVQMAPLLESLQQEPDTDPVTILQAQLPPDQARNLVQWMRQQGWI